MLTAKELNTQKSVRIYYPIGTVFYYQNKKKFTVKSISLFPIRYELEFSNTQIGKSTLTQEELKELLNDKEITIEIPNCYFPDSCQRKDKLLFYFIPIEYQLKVKERLENADFSFRKTRYKKKNNSSIFYIMKKIDTQYCMDCDLLIQHNNGVLVIDRGWQDYEEYLLEVIKKGEQNKIFRKRFRQIITENNINLELAASEMNVPKHTLTSLLKGEMNFGQRTLTKISNYFNISEDFLSGKSDTPTKITFSQEKNLNSKVSFNGEIYNLTPQEKNLLDKFKNLSGAERSQVIGYIDFLLSRLPKKNQA